MIRVKIVPAMDADWLYYNDEWKDFVCDDFDEKVVLTGNRDYIEITEASWWEAALQVVDVLNYYWDSDFDTTPESFVSAYHDRYGISDQISNAKLIACARMAADARNYNDPDFICEIAEVLYPKLDLVSTTLHGSCQGDWVDAIYVKDSVDPDILEDYFFGNLVNIEVYNVYVDEDDEEDEEFEGNDTISYSAYREIDRTEGIENYVRNSGIVNIPPDEPIEVDELW